MTAPQLERVPVDQLHLDPANVRKHPTRNMEAIKASLTKYGQQRPLLVGEGNVVIAGNGTLTAARELGWKDILVQRSDLRGVDATGYAIADNRTAELAAWDNDALAHVLASLKDTGDVDQVITGFTTGEIDQRIRAAIGGDPALEATPPKPENATTQPGDLWELGPHRLICGDATDAAIAKRVLQATKLHCGKLPFMMATDPPYGVSYEPSWRHEAGMNDSPRQGTVANDQRAGWRDAYALFPGDVAYVWFASTEIVEVASDLDACKLERRNLLIWRKPNFVVSRGHYHWQHEPCWYAVRKGKSSRWCGDRKQTTIWDIAPEELNASGRPSATMHPTQKPVECMARPIRNHGETGDAVYDPFAGSGTTLIAAASLDRIACCVELDPGWCDVIVERWENATGGKAQRKPA